MEINLTDKELIVVRRLGKQIDAGIVPVNDVRNFLAGLQRKADQSVSAGSAGKNVKKESRKDKYRIKLKLAK